MLAVAACGDSVKIPQAATGGALTATSVKVQQAGSGHARIDPNTVSFQIDNSGSLVVRVSVTSTASAPQTLTLSATLYDASNQIIGTAVGGNVNVPAGSTSVFELSGQAPAGTISSTTIEVSSRAAA